MTKTIKIFAVIVSITVLLGILALIIYKGTEKLYTDNAHIETQIVTVYPKISGQIELLNTSNNIPVKKGEIIAKIKSKEIEDALKVAEDKLESKRKELKISKDEINKIANIVAIDKANIKKAKLELEYANSDYIRYKNAYQDGSVTKKDLNNAIKNLQIARDNYFSVQETLKNASQSLQAKKSKKDSQDSEIKMIAEEIKQAKLDLSYATIISPLDGIVFEQKITSGDFVQAEQAILNIVPDEVYVSADFDSKKANKIKSGQKAYIKIASINKTCKGKVVSAQNSENGKISAKIIINEKIPTQTISPQEKINVKIHI